MIMSKEKNTYSRLLNCYIVILLFANCELQIANCFAQVDSSHFIFHKVEQGENLYALSKKYCVGLNEITAINSEIKDYVISIGQTIKIPNPENVICYDTLIPAFQFPSNALLHEVKKGETLYGISKGYDSLNLEKIRRWNELKSDTLKLGQQLIVGWKQKTDTISKTILQADLSRTIIETAPARGDSMLLKEYWKIHSADTSQKKEMTIATWLPKTSDNDNGFYALHRTLPSGTILKIKNLMNNENVFVKVIGKLPSIGENANLQLKVSAAAASQLGVLDSRFLVELNY